MSIETSGTVLSESRLLNPPMGLVYQKGGEEFESVNFFAQPSIVFVRCHSALRANILSSRTSFELDAFSILVVPGGTRYSLKTVTAVSHLAVLLPCVELIRKTTALYKLDKKVFAGLFGKVSLIPRTNWLNEIMHRYVYERVESNNSGNEATHFLETEILKEIYYLPRDKKTPSRDIFSLDDQNFAKKDIVVQRALAYIETHLFEKITMDSLVENAFASEATLFRSFERHFSKTPFAFIRERRLEESLSLLKNRQYSVAEVAEMAGYQTTSAFIAAFRREFKTTPAKRRSR